MKFKAHVLNTYKLLNSCKIITYLEWFTYILQKTFKTCELFTYEKMTYLFNKPLNI